MATQEFRPFLSPQARADFEAHYQEKSKRWPIPSALRFVDTPSARTCVRVSGREGDPPLVLLPGARGSSLMWIPNIGALSARHRTYALDLVTDVGLSTPRREFKAIDEYVEWLDEVLEALSPGRPVDLMGMSYGGWVAAAYASRRPARLRKVVLLAPGGVVHRLSWSFFLSLAVLSVRLPGPRHRRGGGRVRRVIRWLFADALKNAGPDREAVEKDLYEMVMSGQYLERPRMPWPAVFGAREWRTFAVPALFLVGQHEKIYSARAAVRRLRRIAPAVRSEIIPGAGHDFTLAAPGLVAQRILSFLEEPLPAERQQPPSPATVALPA
jgi:pimeloyl-ACP methyl ester carboxylesterase